MSGVQVVVRLLGGLVLVGLLNGCATATQAQSTEIQDQLVSVDGQTWVVGTHLVTVASDASVTGAPSVGDQVKVSGRRTDAGELVIDNVQVVADDQAAPQARPAAPPSGQAKKGNSSEKPDKAHKAN